MASSVGVVSLGWILDIPSKPLTNYILSEATAKSDGTLLIGLILLGSKHLYIPLRRSGYCISQWWMPIAPHFQLILEFGAGSSLARSKHQQCGFVAGWNHIPYHPYKFQWSYLPNNRRIKCWRDWPSGSATIQGPVNFYNQLLELNPGQWTCFHVGPGSLTVSVWWIVWIRTSIMLGLLKGNLMVMFLVVNWIYWPSSSFEPPVIPMILVTLGYIVSQIRPTVITVGTGIVAITITVRTVSIMNVAAIGIMATIVIPPIRLW